MTIKKKWRDIMKSPEFKIMIISIAIVGLCYVPWSNFHYGDEPKSIISNKTSAKPNISPAPTTDSSARITNYDKPKLNKLSTNFKRHSSVPIRKSNTSKADQVNGVSVNGNDNHIVGGTGNTVGVNGDQYLGIKQRHLSNSDLQYILSNLDNKDQGIKFYLVNTDSESQKFQEEIHSKLESMGYTTFYFGGTSYNNYIYNKIDVVKSSFGIIITIYPSSNVSQ